MRSREPRVLPLRAIALTFPAARDGSSSITRVRSVRPCWKVDGAPSFGRRTARPAPESMVE
jgi:hypothetical protein